ncbi:DUF4817 domain-containing protein [Trichonephila clavipes]|nr:DUF4817 domain-containing protein [Trichonephila clavipes]
MITNFFIPELNNHDVQKLWFQQDGATCHTARATMDLLKDTFGDRLISRFGPVNWPPRSCDLTPLDYFLWSYVKSLVYADKPQTLDHLEDNIRRVIADIRPQMLEKVNENWTSRLEYIRASRGSPMPEIIFKMKTVKWEDRARAERPCLKEARTSCIAVEMEAIASEAAAGINSAREAARRLGLPPSSVRNILRRILQLYPYKLQLCHELLPADTAQKEVFAKWVFSKMEQDPTWVFNILWTDEAHFLLHGDVNNQLSHLGDF